MPYTLVRLLTSFFLFIGSNLQAADIPPALQEWQGWVLKKHPEISCPFLYNDAQRSCTWPSELRIDANVQGASFTQTIETFADSWARLPGGSGFWPENIHEAGDPSSQSKFVIRERAGIPEVFLSAGHYELKGEIRWDSIPRTLSIPPASGIIKLSLNGAAATRPLLESDSQLWLAATQQSQETQQQDSLQLRAFRKIDDGIPLRITTRLQLDVSGKERELQLGQLLLDGFTPILLTSSLPARLEADGKLRVQVKPGSWKIELRMQSTQPLANLGYKALDGLWPQQEIWVIANQPDLRSIQIAGAPSIDPSQTQLPEDWRALPAYLVTPDTTLHVEELQRGSGDSSNQLTLDKEIWLDFDGNGFTFRDKISGRLQQGWRMETLPPYELRSATLDDIPQLVTRLTDSENTGVEIRNRELDLVGINRLLRNTSIPVSGWAVDFTEANAQLHLPPGWSLLSATGASYVSGSWVSQWSLWDIFLALIITFTVARLTTPLWGGLALLTVLLTFHRAGAPLFIWLNIAALLALLPLVSGKFKVYLMRYAYVSFILLGLLLLPFSVQQARQVFYPQQEFAERNISEHYSNNNGWDFGLLMSSDHKAASEAPRASYRSDVEEIIVTGARAYISSTKQQVSQEYDLSQQVQTGPGVPGWNWRNIHLSWDGPIKPDDVTRLYLIPPAINRVGSVLSLLLPLLLGTLLLRLFLRQTGYSRPAWKIGNRTVMPAILLFAIGITQTDDTHADVLVSNTLLKELETRLTQPAPCLPNCASIESLELAADDDLLEIDIIIHSADSIALPLPAHRQQWWPNKVLIDNNPASLVQNADGQLLVNLRKGRNLLHLQAAISGRDSLTLSFPLPLHNLSSRLQGWQLNGAPSANQGSSALQLSRIRRSETLAKSEHLQPAPIAPFVTVTRQLQLGLKWRVETLITRVAPTKGIINVEIPLLAGESPITGEVVITGDEAVKGKISVQLDADQQQTSWHSTLKAESPLELKAPSHPSWVEIWVLDTAPIWHAQVTGIPAIHTHDLPTWQPWPGESISIAVSRPEAVKGSVTTIDQAQLQYRLGERANSATLQLSLRTNQAGYYDFTLPEGAHLGGLNIDGKATPLRSVNGQVKIPLHPGEQQLEIHWQGSEGTLFKAISPPINLGGHASNLMINIDLPKDRWPLLVGGPSMGPSVLLWGMLVVILLLAGALGRSALTPLKTYQWILLSLGVATVNLYILALIAVWLIILNTRGALAQTPSRTAFKWMQLGLFTLSFVTLLLLLGSIPYSLLSSPDMHINGNGSNAHYLRWYQDQSESQFPQAWIISLPLWSYKLAMLLWSLWLASALLPWVRWGWQQLSHHALWYAPDSILPTTPTTSTDPLVSDAVENKTSPGTPG